VFSMPRIIEIAALVTCGGLVLINIISSLHIISVDPAGTVLHEPPYDDIPDSWWSSSFFFRDASDDLFYEEHSEEHKAEVEKHQETTYTKFHKWEDASGINISSMLSYYRWFATKGRYDDTYGWRNFPIIPLVIAKKSLNSRQDVEIKMSITALKKMVLHDFFVKDRIKPMMEFTTNAINQARKSRSIRSPPRHNLTRFFQIIDDGNEIPFLFEFSDESRCGDNAFKWSTSAAGLEHLHLPIFTMARQNGCNFSFPFPTYLGIEHAKENGTVWESHFNTLKTKYPWENKLPMAVWRGTLTGDRKNPLNRLWLEKHAQEVENGTLIDALIVRGKNASNRIPFEDFQLHKAIIDIDGNGWSGRFLRLLCTNSVVIKLTPSWFDYNMDYIKPWVHYIPADPFSEINASLPQVMKFINDKENEQQILNIISNAQKWCRDNLTYENMKEDILDIFASYVEELDRGDTKWEQIWNIHSNSSFQDSLSYDKRWN
jgi:hypothetical protein